MTSSTRFGNISKITPGERYRQELMGSVSGSRESFSGYCRLAAQAMLQTAMEAEATEFIGRTRLGGTV